MNVLSLFLLDIKKMPSIKTGKLWGIVSFTNQKIMLSNKVPNSSKAKDASLQKKNSHTHEITEFLRYFFWFCYIIRLL